MLEEGYFVVRLELEMMVGWKWRLRSVCQKDRQKKGGRVRKSKKKGGGEGAYHGRNMGMVGRRDERGRRLGSGTTS